MYLCKNCEERFVEPNVLETTYESFYGIETFFNGSTPLSLDVCPFCGDEDIIEILEKEEEDYE